MIQHEPTTTVLLYLVSPLTLVTNHQEPQETRHTKPETDLLKDYTVLYYSVLYCPKV